MNTLNKISAIFIFILFSHFVNAQFTISGEFRPKFMAMDGYKELRNTSKYPYGLVIQRSRLSLDYTKDNLSFAFSIQDVRVWGQDAVANNNNNIGVYEAYVNYVFCKQWSVKIGRQQLKYDDERLLSNNNWRDYNTIHDIAVFRYKRDNHNFKIDFGGAVNNPVNYQNYLIEYPNKNYKYLGYMWINKLFMEKKLETSLIGMVDVNQKPLTINNYSNRYTLGPYLNYKNKNFNLTGSFYYQTGKLADEKKVNAMFYSLKAGYKINKILDLSIGYDHYSGTDFYDTTKAKKESTTFDKLYGSGHSFLGYMDYFNGNASDITKGAGIKDLFIKVNFNFNDKNALEATYHYFMLDNPYFLVAKKASIKYDRALGSEIDLLYSYKPSKIINISLGYSFLIPTETLEKLHAYNKGDSKFAHFAYLMLTFKSVFFTYTEK